MGVLRNWSVAGFSEVRVLGDGGFGQVVLARHLATGGYYAIKYLYEPYAEDPAQLAAFGREAMVLSRVHSTHVARLYDFVRTQWGAAIVMEAVPGVSLRRILTEDGVLAPESALALLKGSLLGLAAAHQCGAVHRDYKPDNVLVQPDRQSKLVDFGIALLAGEVGEAVGTPAYMAPEQWHGAPASPASDVYSATCVFFQCLTGHRPYESSTVDEIGQLHASAPIPAQAVPEAVQGLVFRGMAKNPTSRPADAAAFVADLEVSARAGYGEDWEERGWGRLAERAAALLVLSPLGFLAGAAILGQGTTVAGFGATSTAAAGIGTGAGSGAGAAGGGGAAAAGGGAAGGGAGGGAAASTGTFGGVLAKVGAFAAATAVVAGGVVVVTQLDDGASANSPQVINVSMQRKVERFSNPNLEGTTDYPVVSGMDDPALQRRINQALAEPVRSELRSVRDSIRSYYPLNQQREENGSLPPVRTTTRILLQTNHVISVAYKHEVNSRLVTTGSWDSLNTVTVDLDTGRELTPEQTFTAATRTKKGMIELLLLLSRHKQGGLCGYPVPPFVQNLEAERMTSKNRAYRYLQVAFTKKGAEFDLELAGLGYETACYLDTVNVPYRELGGVLTPEILRKLRQR